VVYAKNKLKSPKNPLTIPVSNGIIAPSEGKFKDFWQFTEMKYAVTWYEENPKKTRVFDSLGRGGYLIWMCSSKMFAMVI
jgi:hypothetical protein